MSPLPPGCEAKLRRAEYHFNVLRAQVDSALKPNAYGFRTETNADLSEYRFYLKFKRPLPVEDWGLILGDGFHCLRSALDHCVYAIGIHESGSDPPPNERDLQFPITPDEAAWGRKEWHVASLSEDARAAIKGLQPHDSSDDFGFRPLGGVEEIDIADKHRVLTVVLLLPIFGRNDISGGIGGQHFELSHATGPLKEDTPFLTAKFDRPTPNVKVRHTLVFEPGIPRIHRDGVIRAAFLWDAIQKSTTEVRRCPNALSDFC